MQSWVVRQEVVKNGIGVGDHRWQTERGRDAEERYGDGSWDRERSG